MDGSYSGADIHNYNKCIIKKHETLPTNPAIDIHINRTNNRLVFKISDGYKLELQTKESLNFFSSTKK